MMIALAAAALLAVLLLSGCMTPQQHFYAGQGADLATTYYALEVDGRFEEGNPMADDFWEVCIMKAVVIGLTELAAHKFPESANVIYWVGAIAGYTPSAWNTYQLATH